MRTTSHNPIVLAARDWLGTPYVHQASCKHVGCDCLGLIRGVWRDVIGNEPELPPPYSPDWAERNNAETLIAAASRHLICKSGTDYAVGDVLIFRYRNYLPAKHMGIVVSSETMIHAQERVGVVEVPINNWWHRHIAAVFEYPVQESI